MASLGRKYLAAQGTSTPAERVISKLGLTLTKKRLRMKGELFLSDCLLIYLKLSQDVDFNLWQLELDFISWFMSLEVTFF